MTDAIQLESFDEDSYYQDRLGFFARLRESRPVTPVRMPGYGRAWIVTRYADVRTVLTDPRLAKDVHRWPGGGWSRPSEATGVYAHMLHADPPEHTQLRRAVRTYLRLGFVPEPRTPGDARRWSKVLRNLARTGEGAAKEPLA